MSDSDKSYRVAILGAILALTFSALGVGAFFGMSHTPNHVYQSKENADHGQNHPSQMGRDRAGLPYLAESVASSPEPYEGNELEKRDLAAQESMAVWAFWMLIVSGLSAVITSLGTGLLLWQIMLTREAVKDTGYATVEMRRANDIAEKANARARSETFARSIKERTDDQERRRGERRQLRAYVDFESVEWAMVQRRKEPNTIFRGVRVSMKNYGQTPADQLTVKATFFLKQDGFSQQVAEDVKEGLGGIMPGDAYRSKLLFALGEEVWEEIGDEHLRMVVSIAATYVDAFGDPHTLSSVYQNDGWQPAFGFVAGSRIQT